MPAFVIEQMLEMRHLLGVPLRKTLTEKSFINTQIIRFC